jgi:streptomycin 6-kinase
VTRTGIEATDIPRGAIARLTMHYGPSVSNWLTTISSVIDKAACAWGVTVCGFHDGGWASVVAHGTLDSGQRVVIKATPERDRYRREFAALRHWRGRHVPRLLATDDARQLLLMETVGQRPGGSVRPADHERRVARRLPELHRSTTDALPDVPHVKAILQTQTLPELRGSGTLRNSIGASVASGVVTLGEDLAERGYQPTLLHGDLYAENVAFDAIGEPRFLDPRGMTGPTEYDWAFWCVFYVNEGFTRRLSIVDGSRLADTGAVLRWSAVLAASRIRYQLDAGIGEGMSDLHEVLTTPAVWSVIGAAT